MWSLVESRLIFIHVSHHISALPDRSMAVAASASLRILALSFPPPLLCVGKGS
jgi:hypothetical protein